MKLPGSPARLLSLALGLLALNGGCHLWTRSDPPPPAAATAEQESFWSSHLRQPTPTGQQLGIDSRAREIERNLGVR